MATERLQRRIDSLLDEAEEAVSELNWTVVQDRAQAVLGLDPDNADGLALRAAAQRELETTDIPASAQPAPQASPPTTTTPAPVHHPTSFANGRYQVKRFLGEGGKKRVYVAYDGSLDREVALAVIKTESLDETSKTRITREAQAMGRLGDHPHILQIHDLGEDNGRPYMVLPLMPGGDVERLIDQAPNHQIPLEQAMDIAKQVCLGLEFAHSRGIVHRDLKPGNVWLTEDGTAKIGDFGLAVALDRSRLTQEGMMVGTVAYMPPEQAMGGSVTPRSDLYSLGAMLYEMVTGRPPFLGDDSVSIIGQHINTPPVAPTWHNGQCPRSLEALIMRLLAKNPSERPESATDVLSALAAIDLATSVEQPAAGVDDGHALDSLAGGVFVGRQREMGELKACLEDALSGRGRLVTLVGEPGIGKTRTALELATYAGLRQAQVLWGRCYEGEGAPPYWPWVQAIRSYVRDVDLEELRSDMGAGAADIAEVVSDVKEQLPGLVAPLQLEPEQARFRLFDSITAFLKNAGRRQPLVLVLDDLHWADHPSLLLLEFVAKELGNARLLIVCTYRDVELSRQHPLSQTLGELTRSAEGGFQRVLLRGLGQEDVGRFIELASGVAPPTGLVEAVHRQTEGNPLFVTEVVRLLVQEGELTQDKVGERDSWSVRIPEGVREVIGRRLDRLSERCNETLTIASVISREFTVDQLSPLIDDISGDRLLEVLEEALAARVIEELPRSVGHYQFTHALIQETLSEELSTTRKVRLHARIAESLELLYGAEAEAHGAELAHHFTEAQTVLGTEKLVRYSLLAGDRALATYAHEEALAHFNRGLAAKKETQPMDSNGAALLFGLGRAQSATLQEAEARVSLSRALDYYIQVADVEMAVSVAEYPLLPVFGVTRLTELVARALPLVPPDSHEAGRLLSRYGLVVYQEVGDDQRTQEAFSQALTIAQREGDPALETITLAAAADVDWYQFRPQQVIERGRQAIELAGRVGDLRAEVRARYYTGLALDLIGDFEGARLHAEAMLHAAERLRDRSWLANALWISGGLIWRKGDWQACRNFTDRGLATEPDSPPILCTRAVMEYEVGDIGQAESHLERLLELMRLSTPGVSGLYALSVAAIPIIARITGAANWFDVAEEAAEGLLSSPFPSPLFDLWARVGLGLMAVQQGDVAAAKEQYAALQSESGIMLLYTGTDRVLGLLAQTTGNIDQAMAHFEDALAFCRKGGYRPELAWSCCDYADTLLQRNGDGDRAKAIALLDESLAISRELGMRPLMERVLSRKDILTA